MDSLLQGLSALVTNPTRQVPSDPYSGTALKKSEISNSKVGLTGSRQVSGSVARELIRRNFLAPPQVQAERASATIDRIFKREPEIQENQSKSIRVHNRSDSVEQGYHDTNSQEERRPIVIQKQVWPISALAGASL